MSKPTIAGGRTFTELERDAKKAIDSGMSYWPKVVLELLKLLLKKEAEMQQLKQGELFAPPSSSQNARPLHE
jgi:hypothetical protein